MCQVFCPPNSSDQSHLQSVFQSWSKFLYSRSQCPQRKATIIISSLSSISPLLGSQHNGYVHKEKSGNSQYTKMPICASVIYPVLIALALKVQGNRITHYLEFPEVLVLVSFFFLHVLAQSKQHNQIHAHKITPSFCCV